MPLEPLLVSLERLAATSGGTGLADATQHLSLQECIAGIRGATDWFKESGLRPGDRVALIGSNTASFALAYFAVHAARGIAVPIGNDLSSASILDVLSASRPAIVLADNSEQSLPSGFHTTPPVSHWISMARGGELYCTLDDPADLLFTTGTTGRKKGVLLSHRNIASAATNINAFVQPRADDIEIVSVPLSHSFGLGRLRCWAQIGHTLALERGLRNPAFLFKRLIDLRATGLAIVPAGIALLRLLIKDRFADAKALRYVEIGSAALSQVDRAWLRRMLPNARICHHYGLTEASRSAFTELHSDANKDSTIGRPSPNVKVIIADEQGRSVPPGQSGEILVRGEMVMQGYWEQPELTADALRDGWLHTGDEGWADMDGFFFLKGRRSDIINVGGIKVAPQDVELCLCAINGIKDAACIGIDDPRGVLGQVVKAFIVCTDEIADTSIFEQLRLTLPEHEIPRVISRVELLPKTDSGKIKRAELRKREST
jgi:long-chain acyl-CoA synthetase